MKKMLLALALLTATPAFAGEPIDLPPADYLTREPSVTVEVHVMPLKEVDATCHAIYLDVGPDSHFRGCTLLLGHHCDVNVPNDLTPQENADALKHEKYGHCNGLVHGSDGKGWYLPDGVTPAQ